MDRPIEVKLNDVTNFNLCTKVKSLVLIVVMEIIFSLGEVNINESNFPVCRNHYCDGDPSSGSGKSSLVSSTSPKQGGKREEGWKEVVRK